MFINAMPSQYVHGRTHEGNGALILEIPPAIRAPLSLSSGQHAFFFWSDAQSAVPNDFSSERKSLELVFTPFHPAEWRDLWRLDIQYYDSPGLMRRLFGLLKDNDIEILTEESRNAFIPEYHLKSLVLDCRRYHNDIDEKSVSVGKPDHRTDLMGLRNLIVTSFIEHIRMTRSGQPRLILERNFTYENLSEVERIKSEEISKGWLRIEPRVGDERKAVVEIPADLPVLRMTEDTSDRFPRRKDAVTVDLSRFSGPVAAPNSEPVAQPTSEPAAEPSLKDTSEPTADPNSDIDPTPISKSTYVTFATNVRSKMGYAHFIEQRFFDRNFHFLFYVKLRRNLFDVIAGFEAAGLNILRSQVSIGPLGLSWFDRAMKRNPPDAPSPIFHVETKTDEDGQESAAALPVNVDVAQRIIGEWGGSVHTVNVYAESRTVRKLGAVRGAIVSDLALRAQADPELKILGLAYNGEIVPEEKLGANAAPNSVGDGPAEGAPDAPSEIDAFGKTRPETVEKRTKDLADRVWVDSVGERKELLHPLSCLTVNKARLLRELRDRGAKARPRLDQSDLKPHEKQALESLDHREALIASIRRELLRFSVARSAPPTPKPAPGMPTLFLSYGFEKPWSAGIRGLADKIGRDLRIHVETGAPDPGTETNQGRIMDTVRDRILAADMFLVVFTPDDSAGGAWLSIELGIALGAGKPVAVVAHQHVSEEKSFSPLTFKYAHLGSANEPFESHLEDFMRRAMIELNDELLKPR